MICGLLCRETPYISSAHLHGPTKKDTAGKQIAELERHRFSQTFSQTQIQTFLLQVMYDYIIRKVSISNNFG